jgi:hypothetical protein
MAPLPVPRSSTRAGFPALGGGEARCLSARSTTSSVSGLGIRTSGVTASASDQNSFSPSRYAIGSPSARRVSKAS